MRVLRVRNPSSTGNSGLDFDDVRDSPTSGDGKQALLIPLVCLPWFPAPDGDSQNWLTKESYYACANK